MPLQLSESNHQQPDLLILAAVFGSLKLLSHTHFSKVILHLTAPWCHIQNAALTIVPHESSLLRALCPELLFQAPDNRLVLLNDGNEVLVVYEVPLHLLLQSSSLLLLPHGSLL